jgi:predicted permease
MDQVLSAVHIVLSIFLMIGLGMFLNAIGWLKDEHSELVSRLVVKVALPAMIINNMFLNYTRAGLVSSVAGILIPFLSMLATFFLGRLIAAAVRLPRRMVGVFTCMFAFSNSVFIGVPVSQALFGEAVTPYTLLYYIANTMLFWTIGYASMRKDGGMPTEKASYRAIPQYLAARRGDPSARTSPAHAPARAALNQLSKVLPIPLLVFFPCVILILLGARLPKFVLDAAGYVGKLVTPMALLYSGMILMRMVRNKRIRWMKAYEWVIVGRFVAAPLLLIGSVWLVNLAAGVSGATILQVPALMRDALIIQASMPVMAQTPIVAASCGSDEEYAAGGIALTTALSLVFIPLYMFVITRFM